MAARLIKLRYPGTCACGVRLEKGSHAWHDGETKSVRCLDCHEEIPGTAQVEPLPEKVDTPPIAPSEELAVPVPEPTEAPALPTAACEPETFSPGTGGAAARREYERRKAKDDAALAQIHAFWLAANRFFYPDGKQTTHAWKVGAEGEERLARLLEELMEDRVGYPLHDRRMPKSRGNIDHLFVGPGGVFVIDAKHFKGADISVERVGGLFGPRRDLLKVNGRERPKLLAGVLAQAEAVANVLEQARVREAPVVSVLCFVDGLLPARKSKRTAQGVKLITLKGTRDYLTAEGPLSEEQRHTVAMTLHTAMPPMGHG